MELANRWQDRNLPKLESVISWIIIILIMAMFLRHTLVIFARAEMSSVNSTVLNINSAIQYQAAIALMKNDHETLAQLATVNPFAKTEDIRQDFIEAKIDGSLEILPESMPFLVRRSHYLGEYTGPDVNTMQDGAWYYDDAEHTLVYLVRNKEFFYTDLPGSPRIRYKVVIDYVDNNDNRIFDAGTDGFLNIQLRSIDRYEWEF